jgi:hypothetical protein
MSLQRLEILLSNFYERYPNARAKLLAFEFKTHHPVGIAMLQPVREYLMQELGDLPGYWEVVLNAAIESLDPNGESKELRILSARLFGDCGSTADSSFSDRMSAIWDKYSVWRKSSD